MQAFGGRVDVTVELAVCRLLLGDPLAAEAALRLAPDPAGPPDEGVAQFVLVRTMGVIAGSDAAGFGHRVLASSPACGGTYAQEKRIPLCAATVVLDITQLGDRGIALQVLPDPNWDMRPQPES